MANHKQHITFSTISGIVFSGLAWYPCGFPLSTCILAGGLCSVGGMVPDIDSDSSRSFRDCMSITACFVSLLLIMRLCTMGVDQELVVIIGALAYIFFKQVVERVIKKVTVHRGIMHSIPYGILCGEIVFLLETGTTSARALKAIGFTVGFLSHLLLDEIYSFEVSEHKIRIKKSLGTALKFLQMNNLRLTTLLYVLLAGTTYISVYKPALLVEWLDDHVTRFADISVKSVEKIGQSSQNFQQQLNERTAIGQYFSSLTNDTQQSISRGLFNNTGNLNTASQIAKNEENAKNKQLTQKEAEQKRRYPRLFDNENQLSDEQAVPALLSQTNQLNTTVSDILPVAIPVIQMPPSVIATAPINQNSSNNIQPHMSSLVQYAPPTPEQQFITPSAAVSPPMPTQDLPNFSFSTFHF